LKLNKLNHHLKSTSKEISKAKRTAQKVNADVSENIRGIRRTIRK
jgi:hypothetical protein